jgi:hypothetical protein
LIPRLANKAEKPLEESAVATVIESEKVLKTTEELARSVGLTTG